jgi:hypothetical protein
MKLRRLIPLALAAYGVWKRLSPQQKRRVRTTINGASHGLRSALDSKALGSNRPQNASA